MPKKRELQLAESLLPSVEKVQAEIMEPSVLEEMSLAEYQQQKQWLEAQRKSLALILDKRKLKHSTRIMDNMEIVLDRIGEAYSKDAVSAMDLKFLTESYLNMQKALANNARFDSLDSNGKSARISIKIEEW